ncbi:hypothetical protein Tsubulata_029927, partial [Turnera subulata]
RNPEVGKKISTLALVSKLVSDKPILPFVLNSIIDRAWKPRFPLDTKEIRPNVFIFSFENEDGRARVLGGAPWTLAIEEVELKKSPFWVHVHGLSPDEMGDENCEVIAAMIGEFVSSDLRSDNGLGYSCVMNLKIMINVDEPLSPGFMNEREDGEEVWVQFKYDKLLDLCYNCGRMGHVQKACSFQRSIFLIKYLVSMRSLRAEHWVRRGFDKPDDLGRMQYRPKRSYSQGESSKGPVKVARAVEVHAQEPSPNLVPAVVHLESESRKSMEHLVALLMAGGLEQARGNYLICANL